MWCILAEYPFRLVSGFSLYNLFNNKECALYKCLHKTRVVPVLLKFINLLKFIYYFLLFTWFLRKTYSNVFNTLTIIILSRLHILIIINYLCILYLKNDKIRKLQILIFFNIFGPLWPI